VVTSCQACSEGWVSCYGAVKYQSRRGVLQWITWYFNTCSTTSSGGSTSDWRTCWSSFLTWESCLMRPKFCQTSMCAISSLTLFCYDHQQVTRPICESCGDRCQICCVHAWAILCCDFMSNFCSYHQDNLGWSSTKSCNEKYCISWSSSWLIFTLNFVDVHRTCKYVYLNWYWWYGDSKTQLSISEHCAIRWKMCIITGIKHEYWCRGHGPCTKAQLSISECCTKRWNMCTSSDGHG